MATSTAPSTTRLGDVVRWRAMAEWNELEAMLDYRDAEMARTASVEPPMRRQIERSAICLSIGEATGLSEGQVQGRLSAAGTVREQAPSVWDAFGDGLVDFTRVRDIAATIDQLKRAESVTRLDRLVVTYAVDHTGAELRAWLRRFVQRVEADLAVERAEDERRHRHVAVRHGADSMGTLYAYLPSHELAAIEARLRKEARRNVADDDERTVAQREADQLVAWCTHSEAATSAVDANIAVMIDADVLAGAVAGFAESTDGRWAVPAGWIAAVVGTGSTFWHRIVTDPVTDDLLSHEYLGRFSPDTLNVALRFRDGVCQSPGCMVPAERCDIDHREPWPEGRTRADNLGPLCRRHHTMKGHGVLKWSTGPPGRRDPLVIEIYLSPTSIEFDG
ncbi:HNH endonuclease signature motif containing protein [Aeromicrobium wangtongii]|uniref:HNH endonuclease n=1 Tax=Aeromicrobium wangtongii TaxID=2969247 RepID=A0ABY5MCP8_9ACTN|nr:HNH endonuclease signature motif containing protein [Aeromicrobium wangtongii]MCD9197404.1 HNH endonuclease [Aeromicrobium wangtongii]UUP14898.1 HNH endonuclease [Aeromicrobium wangtongii]